MKIKRVCHITDLDIRFGDEEIIDNLCASLDKKKVDLVIITKLSCAEDSLADPLKRFNPLVFNSKVDSMPGLERGVYTREDVTVAYRTKIKGATFGIDCIGMFILKTGPRSNDDGISPGPLIARTHSLKPGWQMYDLVNERVIHVKVSGSHGYVLIPIIDGEAQVPSMPKQSTVHYQLENTTFEQYLQISSQLSKQYDIINHTVATKLPETVVNPKQIMHDYVKQFDGADKILALHDQISSSILTKSTGMHWSIRRLEFDNTLVYGPGNVIDFTQYETNSIIGIIAPNRYGKTAILDIIMYCLFEKLSRGGRNDIMNKECQSFRCAITIKADHMYRIERKGKIYNNKFQTSVQLTKNGNNITGQSKAETNRRIESIVGSYNDYLATYFYLTKGHFIDMSQPQKKEYIFDLLNITSIATCHATAKSKLKKYQAVLKTIDLKPGLLQDHAKRIKAIDMQIRSMNKPQVDIIVFNPPPKTSLHLPKGEEGNIKQLKRDLEKYLLIQRKINDLQSQIEPIPHNWNEIHNLPKLDAQAIRNKIRNIIIQPVSIKPIDLLDLDEKLIEAYQNPNQITIHQAIVLKKEILYNKRLLQVCKGVAYDMCLEHLEYLKQQVKVSQEHQINITDLSSKLKSKRQAHIDYCLDKLIHLDNLKKQDKMIKLQKQLELAERYEYLNKYTPSVEKNKQIRDQLAKYESKEVIQNKIIDTKLKLERAIAYKSNQKHIKLHELKMIHYETKLEWYNKWSAVKQERDRENNIRQGQLARLEAEKKVLEKEIREFIALKQRHTELMTKVNLFQQYVSMTHPNGIQYETIKQYLPVIAEQVNQLLEYLGCFTIKFEYDTDLNIIMLPSRVNLQMASGSERFIVSIALMIVLGRIAMNGKPNFVVIDEGWAKVDATNRSKLNKAMDLLRSNTDHIIMISNDTSLIAKPNYEISITRQNGMSYIQAL